MLTSRDCLYDRNPFVVVLKRLLCRCYLMPAFVFSFLRRRRNQPLYIHFFQVYGVNVVVSSSDGKVREQDLRTTVFKRNANKNYHLKMKASRSVCVFRLERDAWMRVVNGQITSYGKQHMNTLPPLCRLGLTRRLARLDSTVRFACHSASTNRRQTRSVRCVPCSTMFDAYLVQRVTGSVRPGAVA